MRFRCNECRGEYDDASPDGVPYAHVCPPITRVKVKRDGQPRRVDLADLRDTDLIRVQRGDQAIEILVSAMQPGDVRLDDVSVDRPAGDRRDETADPGDVDRSARPDKNRRIRAEGRGRTPI